MADAETLKQANKQAVGKATKALIVAVNEEDRRQAMRAGHQKASEQSDYELEDHH